MHTLKVKAWAVNGVEQMVVTRAFKRNLKWRGKMREEGWKGRSSCGGDSVSYSGMVVVVVVKAGGGGMGGVDGDGRVWNGGGKGRGMWW